MMYVQGDSLNANYALYSGVPGGYTLMVRVLHAYWKASTQDATVKY